MLERGADDRRAPTRRARRIVVSERSNFPTDLYIAEALARERGFELVLVDDADELAARCSTTTARC